MATQPEETELPPCDPACHTSSAINPADMNGNINNPQTVSDHEPSVSQLTNSISDPQNPDSSISTNPQLPQHPPMSSPTFTWGNLSSPEFDKLLDTTYDEVVHWRRNCFSVPFGKAGRDFVSELSRLYLVYGSASTLEAVALKAATVLPILLLQKPSKRSKTKDHTKCLERRLASWSNGGPGRACKGRVELYSRGFLGIDQLEPTPTWPVPLLI